MGTESVPVEPEESPAVPEPDVAEATSGLPEGWREVVRGLRWERGSGFVRVHRIKSDIKPYHVFVPGGSFGSSSTLTDIIKATDKRYPASEYP